MSLTPRTDEAEANAIASGIPISMVCRQLERELNDTKNEVKGFCRLLDEDNVMLAIVRLERIIKELNEAKETIKTLQRHISDRANGTDPLTQVLIGERDEALEKLQAWKEMDDFRAKMFSEMSGAKCTTLGELHDYVINATKERDEARECLREIVSQLTLVDARASGETWQLATCDGDEVDRWRKAAGLENDK